MSISDAAARASAVKMLTEDELNLVHALEEKAQRYLLPYEIAAHSAVARREGADINKWWGVPIAPMSQLDHADRIGSVILNLMQTKKCHLNTCDRESREKFDWHVFRSDIDLSFGGVTKNHGSSVDELFDGRVDQKSVSSGE